MLSLKKKIIFSDLSLFVIFISLLLPFAEKTMGKVMRSSFESRTKKIVQEVEKAKDLNDLIEKVKQEENFLFQRITLFDQKGALLFDFYPYTHSKDQKISGGSIPLEVEKALQKGQGFAEHSLKSSKGPLFYHALKFDFRGKPLVLRTGFSSKLMRELILDFKMSFLFLGAVVLFLYTIMIWLIMHRLSRPIQQIIQAISFYQSGKEEFLPKITLDKSVRKGEFGKLADTLNFLTEKIQRQIEHLVKQKEETEGILDSLSEGVIAFDKDSKITFANLIACKMLRVSHKELIGRTISELEIKKNELLIKAKALLEEVLKSSQTRSQMCSVSASQKTFFNLISAPIARQGGAILVLQDKTSDFKVIEMGKDFVANASHELRTPITIIRGFAETLQDFPNLTPETLSQVAEKIVRTCGRLDKLVKSLLTLADIENLSEKQFRYCSFYPLVENCKSLILSAHPKANITILTNQSSVGLNADGDLLELALINLFENGIKYSQERPEIQVTLEKRKGQIFLKIKDEGIGIPKADLKHIFDRFYTVDKARSRKSGGAGLGLSIVKTIVEKHKGKIEAFSEEGKGSEFVLTFPLT